MDWGKLYSDIVQLTDISEHLKEFTNLTPENNHYTADCPFHNQKASKSRDSLIVNSDKGIYSCTDCGEYGDIVRLYMKKHNLDAKRALTLIASKEKMTFSVQNTPDGREKLYFPTTDIFNEALDLFNKNVDEIRPYLKSKGYIDDVISATKIGYAKNNNQIKKTITGEKLYDYFVNAGLIVIDEKNSTPFTVEHMDLFKDRIMFPLYTNAGRLIGFAGVDTKDESDVKYLVDSKKPSFALKRLLYGYNRFPGEEEYILTNNFFDADLLMQNGLKAISTLAPLNSQNAEFLLGTIKKIIIPVETGVNANTNDALQDTKNLALEKNLKNILLLENHGIKTSILSAGKNIGTIDYLLTSGNNGFVMDYVKNMSDPILKYRAIEKISKNEKVSIESLVELHASKFYNLIMNNQKPLESIDANHYHAAAFLAHVIKAAAVSKGLASSYIRDVPIGLIPDDESIFPSNILNFYRIIRDNFMKNDFSVGQLYDVPEPDNLFMFLDNEKRKAKNDLLESFKESNIEIPNEVLRLVENPSFFEKKNRSKSYNIIKQKASKHKDWPHELLLMLQAPTKEDPNNHINYLRKKIFQYQQSKILSSALSSNIDSKTLIHELERIQREI